MKQYRIGMLTICYLLMAMPFLFCLMGCTSSSRTIVVERDTLYVERVAERQTIVRDTIETSSRIVEYVIDSLGDWRPQKMVEETTLQRHTQKSGEEEIISEESLLKTKTEIEKNIPSISRWHIWGIFSLLIFLVFILIKF
ncbi:MAG: hypothetical protein IKW05_03495 [Muribaculaceae bacterium]|nr:hypothetical protein [Muribaculaceae bacterium]